VQFPHLRICVGTEAFPVAPKIHFYAEYNARGTMCQKAHQKSTRGSNKADKARGGGVESLGLFVPQLVAGNALCNSTGPPTYKAIWHMRDSYVFEAQQYFFTVFNKTSNK
jgi:hypothetical protein